MQCHLSEHLCFDPNIPLPGCRNPGETGASSMTWTLDPHQLSETCVSWLSLALIETFPNFCMQEGFDLEVPGPPFSRKFHYERFPALQSDMDGSQRKVNDIVIIGEVSSFFLFSYELSFLRYKIDTAGLR
jgi:hypothetical protein